MKFPSLSSTLRLLKPFGNSENQSKNYNELEKTLYDHIEEIISITHTEENSHVILDKFYNLSDIQQQIMIFTLIEHNFTDTLTVILQSDYSVNYLIKGQTPLHFAIENQNLDIVALLIKNKADLELIDIYKETALSCAVRNQNREIIRYLIKQKQVKYSYRR